MSDNFAGDLSTTILAVTDTWCNQKQGGNVYVFPVQDLLPYAMTVHLTATNEHSQTCELSAPHFKCTAIKQNGAYYLFITGKENKVFQDTLDLAQEILQELKAEYDRACNVHAHLGEHEEVEDTRCAKRARQ